MDYLKVKAQLAVADERVRRYGTLPKGHTDLRDELRWALEQLKERYTEVPLEVQESLDKIKRNKEILRIADTGKTIEEAVELVEQAELGIAFEQAVVKPKTYEPDFDVPMDVRGL